MFHIFLTELLMLCSFIYYSNKPDGSIYTIRLTIVLLVWILLYIDYPKCSFFTFNVEASVFQAEVLQYNELLANYRVSEPHYFLFRQSGSTLSFEHSTEIVLHSLDLDHGRVKDKLCDYSKYLQAGHWESDEYKYTKATQHPMQILQFLEATGRFSRNYTQWNGPQQDGPIPNLSGHIYNQYL